MNGLHWFAQLVLTGVFLFDGFGRFYSYRGRPDPSPARPGFRSIQLPYELAVVVALVEIAGALVLWVPSDLWAPDILPRLGAGLLALLAAGGIVYHFRRQEPAAPNIALFLLALLVIMGRWAQ